MNINMNMNSFVPNAPIIDLYKININILIK